MERREKRSAGEPTYQVVSPLGRPVGEPLAVNPALPDLNGKTVGELCDFAFKGDEMFPILREQLRRRYPDVRFVAYQTFGNTHGPEEVAVVARLPKLLREHECDVVISAVGA